MHRSSTERKGAPLVTHLHPWIFWQSLAQTQCKEMRVQLWPRPLRHARLFYHQNSLDPWAKGYLRRVSGRCCGELCATTWTYHHTRRVAIHSKTCFRNWLSLRIGFGSPSVLEPSGMGFVFTKTFSEGSQLIPKYHLRKLWFHFF